MICRLLSLRGINVEFFLTLGSNVSMGNALTDENGTANLTWPATIAPGSYEILVMVN